MKHHWQATTTFLAVLAMSCPLSAEILEGHTLLKKLHVSQKEIRKLESGEVVTKLASEFEQSPRELAIDATVIVRRPLQDLIAESEDEITLVPGKLILDSGELTGEGDFGAVAFSKDEAEEAKRWLDAVPGDDLNLGKKDLETISRLKAHREGRSDLELGSEAVREVLAQRFRAYLNGGLSAIEPYARSRDKEVSAGAELKLSNEQLFGIDKYFPSYFDTLVNFPSHSDCCEHRYMWMKAKVRKRPTFILVHRIVQESENFVLVTERHIYASHTLNSLQLTLGWLPYEESGGTTYLGIATSANSDYLTGFVGKMIRILGANKGAEMVGDVLVDIRDDLEAGREPGTIKE